MDEDVLEGGDDPPRPEGLENPFSGRFHQEVHRPAVDGGLDVNVLGDLIISVERAEEQAADYGHSVRREMAFLTVHGMLHLLGYDHMEEEERAEMEAEQRFVMEKLGIPRE